MLHSLDPKALQPPHHPIHPNRSIAQEVWRPNAGAGDTSGPGGDAAAGGRQPPLLIGAVLDGHGLLGESAAKTGGRAVVLELRRLVGLCSGVGGPSAGGGGRDGGIGGGDRSSSGGGSSSTIAATAATTATNGSLASGASSGSLAARSLASSSAGSADAPLTAPPAAGEPQTAAAAVAAAAAKPPPLPLRPLASIPESDMRSLVDAAFQAGHASALTIYDHPPRTACYPDSHSGASGLYCLHTPHDEGQPMYSAAPGGRANGASWRPLECGATCTVALLQGRRLVVGNVGDSSAVLGTLDEDGGVAPRLLTRQHCGLHPDEAARIADGYEGRVRILPHDGCVGLVCLFGRRVGFGVGVCFGVAGVRVVLRPGNALCLSAN
jgi:hypothetical protein